MQRGDVESLGGSDFGDRAPGGPGGPPEAGKVAPRLFQAELYFKLKMTVTVMITEIGTPFSYVSSGIPKPE